MGVYIKGMDMPRTGQVYTFEVVKHDEMPYMRIRTGFEVVAGVCGIELEEKWEEYPLVGVPVPHGRLIDRDALVADTSFFDGGDWHYGYSNKQIESAPTVLEAEGKDDD